MRPIHTLVWHTTATPEGREVSAKEIDSWHKDRGWSGIGYHKVVHLDGSVSEGRPESKKGAHVGGYNTGTLGYVYVGGMDAEMEHPKDTRTPAQKATMMRLTKEAIAKYGITRVAGHNEFAAKACPSFDVQKDPLGKLTRKPLRKSRTVVGASVASAGGVAGVVDTLREADGSFSSGTTIGAIIGVLVVAGALWALYARWDDAGRPSLLPNWLRTRT